MDIDFLIVGGGVIGLSSAYELALRGAKVGVVERGACGGESSWAGGGILSPLPPWDYPDAVSSLTELSARLYPRWIDEIGRLSGIDPEYRVSGMLVLPAFDEDSAARWCAGHGVRLEQVKARYLVPELPRQSEALWLPHVAQVRNPRLMKALRLALGRMDVRIVENAEVAGIVHEDGKIVRLDTAAEHFEAEHYIVAAGAWSKKLLGDCGARLDIRPIRGQMLLFRAQPGKLRHIVLQDGIYLIPRNDGHILVGSTLEDAGFDKTATEAARNELHAHALRILPALEHAELVRHWAGLRPGSPGNIPTIARHPQLKNLYLNSGHFRYGVTMAPASACILANRLFHQAQPIDVAPYNWPV